MATKTTSRSNSNTDFTFHVEPLDEIQFNNEEISVPIMVELRRRGAEVPTRKMLGAACYDLKSLDNRTIPPKGKAFFDIGLAFKMEKGWTLQIHNRSGLSLIENIIIPGTPKIIDSDYRGNVKICLVNKNEKNSYTVRKKDRIAQMCLVRTYTIDFNVRIIDPDEIHRGEGGLGSTGR